MHPAIPHLIELQRVDHQIAVLRAELDGFPKRTGEAEAKLGSARAEDASAKEAHAQAGGGAGVARADDHQREVRRRAEEVERRVNSAESRLKEAEQAVAAKRK